VKERCHLVYALAPEGAGAAQADDLFNNYIADRSRGLCVYHDHFIGQHGGVAIFAVRTESERDALGASGPLEGWRIEVHPLTFSLTAMGFAAQVDFTLEEYRGTSLEEIAAAEKPERRHWWIRRQERSQHSDEPD
jgi:hypothetical protein